MHVFAKSSHPCFDTSSLVIHFIWPAAWIWEQTAESSILIPGTKEWDPVDRSLVYCERHNIPGNRANPELSGSLFTEPLLNSWRRHYSKQ